MNNEIKTIIKIIDISCKDIADNKHSTELNNLLVSSDIINMVCKDIADKKINKEVTELLIEELLELIKAVEKLETELIKAVVKLERWGVINE